MRHRSIGTTIGTSIGTSIGLVALIGLMARGTAEAGGDPAHGRDLAIERCSQCHVVGDFNPLGGVSNTPSFYIFSERLDLYRERLKTFDQRRPHLGRDLRVPPEDLDDIIAYIEGLERP